MINETKKEEMVVSWLKDHGYYRVESQSNEKRIIEADGKIRRMIVGVNSGMTVRTDFKEKILGIAQSKNREPWIAKVELEKMEICWSKIR